MKERTGRGTPVVNLLPLAPDETIQALVATKDFDSGGHLMFATKLGQVKKTALAEYDKSRREGFIAVALRDNDELVRAIFTSGEDDILMVTRNGSGIRFSEQEVRSMGRDAAGVRGIRLRQGDELVSFDVVYRRHRRDHRDRRRLREAHQVRALPPPGQGWPGCARDQADCWHAAGWWPRSWPV